MILGSGSPQHALMVMLVEACSFVFCAFSEKCAAAVAAAAAAAAAVVGGWLVVETRCRC